MDIRRYFGAATKSKSPPNKRRENNGDEKQRDDGKSNTGGKSVKASRKRMARIESDDEDEEQTLPLTKKAAKERIEIDDGDDDVDKFPAKRVKSEPKRDLRCSPPKQKFMTAEEFFGKAPVKHQWRKAGDERNPRGRTDGYGVHEDGDFVETLKALDEAEDETRSKSVVTTKAAVPSPRPPPPPPPPSRVRHSSEEIRGTTANRTPPAKKKTKNREERVELQASSAEKMRANAVLYQAFRNRDGPSAPGSKIVPQGKEGCFNHLNFVVTGVLDSLEREEAEGLVTKYGGKVQKSVCKNTSYMVVGREAGPAKLEKAEKWGTEQISEDEFLNLIRMRSGTGLQSDNKMSRKKDTAVDNERPKRISRPESKQRERTTEVVDSALAKRPNPIDCGLMWVDKYRPQTTSQIIGQNGDKSNVRKLTTWLENWHRNRATGAVVAKGKSFFGKPRADDGTGLKAALLSGPPGVGKTTSAQLVCKELGFTYVELNASDTRSRRNLQEVVTELLRNKSLTHYIAGNPNDAMKHCLLMDEVDGMSGNEDRAGMQELIQLIRTTRIPIVCMCNDRTNQKIRSLANYCFDLRFQKPRVEQIKGALMSICFKEGVKIASDALHEVIVGANQDIRQILHHLSLWSVTNKNLSVEETTKDAKMSAKDIKMGPFDVVRRVFSAGEQKSMSIHDKSDLFFHDYSLSPLFVQENYLNVVPHAAQSDAGKQLRLLTRAADSISKGDLVERIIRSENQWGLLPTQAMFASVIPGDLLAGHLSQMIAFPTWLGRNSTRGKVDRILQELHVHTRLRTSGNKTNLNMDYLQHILDGIVGPLIRKGVDGVSEAVAIMSDYNLLREDLDAIVDVSLWPNRENPLAKISPKIKAAFTRAYNKTAHLNPYAVVSSGVKGKQSESGMIGEEEEEEEEERDDVKADAMIKKGAPKRKAKKDDDDDAPAKKGAPKRKAKKDDDDDAPAKKGSARKKASRT